MLRCDGTRFTHSVEESSHSRATEVSFVIGNYGVLLVTDIVASHCSSDSPCSSHPCGNRRQTRVHPCREDRWAHSPIDLSGKGWHAGCRFTKAPTF